MSFNYRESKEITNLRSNINWIFLSIFIIEFLLKIIALGKVYFHDPWNTFDFAILSITCITTIINNASDYEVG